MKYWYMSNQSWILGKKRQYWIEYYPDYFFFFPFSKLFDTMPMHIIANWMSKNTTYQRTLNFAYSESNNDKKHQKIPKEVDFQNIEIDRSVLVENVKTLVKKINDLNSTKFAPLDAWQFLSIWNNFLSTWNIYESTKIIDWNYCTNNNDIN